MSITVLRAAILRRAACANARSISTAPTRSSFGLARSARHGAVKQHAPTPFLRPTAVRYVSEEAKAKVNLRKAAVKSSSSIEKRVKRIVAEQLGVKEEEVTNEKSFVDDLGADSLDTVELVMALEEEFETEIPDEEAEKITSVQAAIDYVKCYSG